MDLDNEWLASRKRFLLPALSHHGKGNLAINVGDECFVTGGTWSEALLVERRPDGSALVDYGGRARRWMSNGEWAWHDMYPMSRDLFSGENVLAFNDRLQGFRSAQVLRSMDGSDRVWVVRFDDGSELLSVVSF